MTTNCKQCGAPLRLEDRYCPHCGAENPDAIEHFRRMEELKEEFDETRTEVYKEVVNNHRGYNLFVTLVVLLLANIAMFIMFGQSWEIADEMIARSISKEEIRTLVDESFAAHDYCRVSQINDRYYLRYSDFKEYNHAIYMANDYDRTFRYINDYLYGKTDWADPIVRLGECVYDFYEDYGNALRWQESDTEAERIEQVHEDYEKMIKAELHLTDADLEGIENLSSRELVILISERLEK